MSIPAAGSHGTEILRRFGVFKGWVGMEEEREVGDGRRKPTISLYRTNEIWHVVCIFFF